MPLRKWLIRLAFILALLVLLAIALITNTKRTLATNIQRLPDGSTLELKQIAFTHTNYNYTFTSRGPFLGALARILPNVILSRFPLQNSGSFGFGTTGQTNLFLITHRHQPGSLGLARLRVVSGSTDTFDACWGAHTISHPGEVVNGWQICAFPRRSPTLTLEFLGMNNRGEWLKAGTFEIQNPAYNTFPQWQPEPVPLTKTDGNLALTLARFRTGAPMETELRNPETVARKTELLFTFTENSQPSENWRVQKLNLSDATGNDWFPYLDLVNQRMNWARGGQVEFFGALWPGEHAWKLDVEIVRSSQFPEHDLHTVEVPLPRPHLISQISDEWTHDGVTLKLNALASPETDHPGNLKWIGTWWGANKDKVYSLTAELLPGRQGQRLSLIRSVDQADQPVELLEHRGPDYPRQAFFLKPAPDSQTLRLTFALTRSRTFQFLAQPEFTTLNPATSSTSSAVKGNTP